MAAKLASSKNRPSSKQSNKNGLIKIATLGVAGLLAGLLAGCSVSTNSVALTPHAQVVGNWQFSTTVSALPAFAGNLNVNGSQVSGTLHALPVGTTINSQAIPSGSQEPVAQAISPRTACTTSTTSFPVTGSIDPYGKTSLTSTNFAGGTITLNGTLNSSQNALTSSTVGITSGPCAIPAVPAYSAKYDTITGAYSGTIYSVTGDSLAVTTLFTQSTEPDANGTYHLTGNSTFGSVQPCLPNPPSVSDSVVTGSTLNATYTETVSGTTITVVVNGTFSTDASTLTLNSYHITGGYCDGDSGHGTLTRR